MINLKNIVLAGSLLFGTTYAVAPKTMPQIPEFKRYYSLNTKIPLVSAKGSTIMFMSSERAMPNSSKVQELRGYMNVPVSIIGVEGYTLTLGSITRIRGNTVESIIYSNTRTSETLSDYDRKIAKQENINTNGLVSLWHERYNFSDSTITNLETGKVQKMGNARDFQELYFRLPKDRNLDTLVNIHYCGQDYPINVKIRTGAESIVEADLTYADPKNPSRRKELIDGIEDISIYSGKDGTPYKMVAGAKILDFIIHPEASYDPKIKH